MWETKAKVACRQATRHYFETTAIKHSLVGVATPAKRLKTSTKI